MFLRNTKQNENSPHSEKWTSYVKRFQRVAILTVLFMSLGIQVGSANGEDQDLSTVFHVYSEGEYVGSLANEEKLEQLKMEAIKKAEVDYKNLSLSADSGISVVPERVFSSSTDDEAVLEKLKSKLTVEAVAVAVIIDGKPTFYVKDMSTYNEVLRKLKLQAVSEKQLNAFEARMASTQPIPPLKEDETRLVDILISGDMKAEQGMADPEEVRSADEAMKLLNTGTLEEKKYTVKTGDVLGKIAVAHQMTAAKLMALNPGYTENTLIRLGDELNVTVLKPYVQVEAHYEAKMKKQIEHKKITEEDATMYKGEKKLTVHGSDGEKLVTELIRKQDGVIVGRSIADEHILVEPKDEVTVVGTKEMPSRGTGEFIWPTDGGYVSSQRGQRWGRVHEGIDIARPSSFTIKVADNGVVTDAGWHSTYGNRIVVTHNNGYVTLYAHLSAINVHVGQTVPQGTAIGVMGSTGRSTGVHLHFEVLKNGANINPLSVLN